MDPVVRYNVYKSHCLIGFSIRYAAFVLPAPRSCGRCTTPSLGEQGLAFTRNFFTYPLSPADIRASTSKIAHSTIKFPKKPTKAKRSSKLSSKSKRAAPSEAVQDQYHFLSYVPYRGRVWEMDGLKSAPLECAELDPDESWLEAVRPALRGRIEALAKSGDIRFNLLAIVPCAYHTKMREFELTKREIKYIERRLQDERGENWKDMVRSLHGNEVKAPIYPGQPKFMGSQKLWSFQG